jgi:DNA-binding MarR family transcriptional regulator
MTMTNADNRGPARSARALAQRYKQEHPEADRDAIEVSLRITDCYITQFETMTRLVAALGGSRTQSRYSVLRALYFSPEGFLTPKEIRESIRMAPGNVTYIVDDFEQEGLVVRSADPADGRGTRVSLTPDGEQLAETYVQGMVRLHNYIGDEFTDTEKVLFTNLLERFQRRAATGLEVADIGENEQPN